MTADNTPSGGGVTPPSGTPPVTGTSAGVTPPKPNLEEALLAKIADLEHSLRNKTEENDRHSKKISAHEKAEKEREAAAQAAKDAELSELERLKKQLSQEQQQSQQLIAALKQENISLLVRIEAKNRGIIDDEIAALAIQGKLEFGDDGKPSNLDKALDDLVKNKPYLVSKTEAPADQSSVSPAQTAQRAPAPAVPPMNPGGRAAIPAPGQLSPGQIYTLNDHFMSQKKQ